MTKAMVFKATLYEQNIEQVHAATQNDNEEVNVLKDHSKQDLKSKIPKK